MEGCGSADNSEFIADWIEADNSLNENLKADLAHWKCTFKDLGAIVNASVPTCASNYRPNVTCDKWIYDKTIRDDSIATEVS